MQLGGADLQLTQYHFDAACDGGVVGAVPRDKLLDNGPQGFGSQVLVGNKYLTIPQAMA